MHLVVFAWLQKRGKEREREVEVVLRGKGKRLTLFCHFIGWSSPQPKLLAYICRSLIRFRLQITSCDWSY